MSLKGGGVLVVSLLLFFREDFHGRYALEKIRGKD